MIDRIAIGVASAAALLLCTACAATPEQANEVREQKIYRTGSNIPSKDYGAANMDVASPDIVNPINRPMGGAMGKKPGG